MISNYSVVLTIIVFNCVFLMVLCRDAPIVQIPDQGQVMGFFLKMFRTQTIVGYMGIPYAQPPIEDRRFSPPIVDTLPTWDGVRNGSQMQMQCWSDVRKPIKNHDEIFLKILGIETKSDDTESPFSEDCLYLNLYVPDGKLTVGM